MSARRALKGALAALAVTVALVAPTAALAATAPAANGSIDVQAWPENGSLVVVVALSVPPSVKLPAVVRLPVPDTAQVQWVGEVLGGDPNADPARKYKIKKSPVGGSYAEVTLETTHAAQLDTVMPVLKTSGTNVSATFDWVQSVTSPVTTISMRVPAGATSVRLTPTSSAGPSLNAAGEALYAGDPQTLQPGSKTTVSLSYSTGATGTGATPSKGSSLLYFLFAAIAVAVGVLVILLVRQRGTTPPPAATGRPRRSRPAPEPAATESPESKDEAGDKAGDDDWGFVDQD